jgi:CRISPR/Cas system-associated protein Csm6
MDIKQGRQTNRFSSIQEYFVSSDFDRCTAELQTVAISDEVKTSILLKFLQL